MTTAEEVCVHGLLKRLCMIHRDPVNPTCIPGCEEGHTYRAGCAARIERAAVVDGRVRRPSVSPPGDVDPERRLWNVRPAVLGPGLEDVKR